MIPTRRRAGDSAGGALRLRHPLDREILALAVPALGALAADPLVSMVDTAFVGRLGVTPLGALGVNASVFSLAFVVFNFLAYGTTPMIARAVGRGDRGRAGRLAVEALTLAGIAGAVALVLLQLLAEPILSVMGAVGELREPALAYLRIRALAGPAVLLVTAGHGIFRGWQDTRTPLLVTLGLNAVNLVLDPLLIFGFGWGLEGAAIATALAQWSGAAAFLWLILVGRRKSLGVGRGYRPRPADLLPFLRVGGALLTRTLALIGTMTLATAVATRLGTAAVAAHQVASQLWLLLALVVDALAVAGQAMVARYRAGGEGREGDGAARRALLGHGRPDGAGPPGVGPTAREVADRLLAWGLVVGLVLAGGFLLLRPWLPLLFTSDPTALSRVGSLLPFVIWMQPLNALVFVWDGIFMGAEAFRYLAVQMVLSAGAAAAVLLLVVPLGWGLAGVWWGLVALMAGRGVTLAVRYWR
ncbi:MAG: MATE family efflux transporter [Gemmatimonadota bacterium]